MNRGHLVEVGGWAKNKREKGNALLQHKETMNKAIPAKRKMCWVRQRGGPVEMKECVVHHHMITTRIGPSAKRHVTYVLFDHLALRKGQNAERRKGDYLYITVNIVNLTKYVEVGGHGDQ